MEVKYNNLSNSNLESTSSTSYDQIESSSDESNSITEIRENLKEKYGWLSPSEFYAGGKTSSNKLLNSSLSQVFDDSTSSDDSSAQSYFWCNTLSNWVYFKYTSYMEDFSYTRTRRTWFSGTTLGKLVRVILAVGTGGWTELMNSISIGGLFSKYTLKTLKYNFTMGTAATSIALQSMEEGMSTLKNFSVSSLADLLSTSIYNLISGTTNDVDGELYYDEIYNTENANMPRNCISLYMWNGYFCNWVSVTSFVTLYDRYCKSITYKNIEEYVTTAFMPTWYNYYGKDDEKAIEFFTGWCNSLGITTGSDLYNNLYYYATNSTSSTIAANIATLISSDEDISVTVNRATARILFLNQIGMDPWAFDFLTLKSPLSKLQMIPIDNENSNTWARYHHLESWTKWIPLTRDSCNVKIDVSKTHQLISRPYSYVGWNERDLGGWVHRSIGHPCFFRGNDNILWMCTWNRWTSSRGNRSGSSKGILAKVGKYKVPPTSDIYSEDISDWNTIISRMFDTHDDYGFEEWLCNSDYGIDYEYFTISEEVPSLSAEVEDMADALNPEKTLLNTIVNTADLDEHTLTLGLSTSNDVSVNNELEKKSLLHKYQ